MGDKVEIPDAENEARNARGGGQRWGKSEIDGSVVKKNCRRYCKVLKPDPKTLTTPSKQQT